jgi:hypothetical protein
LTDGALSFEGLGAKLGVTKKAQGDAMKKEALKWSAFGLFLMVSMPVFGEIPPSTGAHSPLRIVVRVYDYAQVPRAVLARAEREAAKVFRKAGVEVQWAHCRGSKADIPDGASCRSPMGYVDLVLKILPPSMAARASMPSNALGFALLSPKIALGAGAYIFYEPVRDLATVEGADVHVALGHVAAHEVGHILLGAYAHCPSGIMSSELVGKSLRAAARGGLLFTRSESERIRATVVARMARQDTFENTTRQGLN